MPLKTELLDVLTAPGYVSIIEGDPGSGKTTLALKACARHGNATYISYADPEVSITRKLKLVDPQFSGSFNVVSMLSGKPDRAFSLIEEAIGRGELVVVDSLDAMFYGMKEEVRAFLQMIYGSVKAKSGSLIMISEGLNDVARQVRFVFDVIVEVKLVDVLGKGVRAIRLLKDRDHEIEHALHYMTFSDMSILEPFPLLEQPALNRFSSIQRPKESETILETGPNILEEFDLDVSDIRAKLVREFMAAEYVMKGYSVNYTVGPNEDISDALIDFKSLVGNYIDRLNIINIDARATGYKAIEFFNKSVSLYRPNSVNIINLLAEEEFAVNAPEEYEAFINLTMKENQGRITLHFGHSNLNSTRIEMKYVNAARKLTVTDGFLFWRSIKPQGPVYFVKMEPEKGSMEFVRMT
ncbi:MAG: hypothetical protein JRN26_00415 [Nitrososphaerota archaeon]|jgi:KaiC/GvpD/RAD55 family RecA-like ATPase|nr:hypothetical protein [Nitrososphaerota archaeon]MDG6927758.1 hypothetical protein [Nitrososphaerota archaeon]MDG6930297.1 hypothetical protein [Nitrososphaerota archaeon]MDG6932720.1 hypothetical protein [Nitrososphaerota archaeon]MDG6935343.1 hypothetical protein [Nitrososphaerota archaeon]